MQDINNAWVLEKEPKCLIKRKFKFKNFAEALDFLNKVGAIAEKQDHHPDIEMGCC